MVPASLVLGVLVLAEVLQEGVDLCEGAEEVFVCSEAALLDDSVAALAGLKEAQLVLLGDPAGGLAKFAHALDVAVFAFFECALAAGLVNVSHVLFSFFRGVPLRCVHISL